MLPDDDVPPELMQAMQAYPADLSLSLIEEEAPGPKASLLLHRPLIAMTSTVLRDAMGALSQGESLQVGLAVHPVRGGVEALGR